MSKKKSITQEDIQKHIDKVTQDFDNFSRQYNKELIVFAKAEMQMAKARKGYSDHYSNYIEGTKKVREMQKEKLRQESERKTSFSLAT